MSINKIENCYNKVSDKYTEELFNELVNKPLDRYLLDKFCDTVGNNGRVCDMGCGPGHVTQYLRNNDVDVFGLDISEGMLNNARSRNPDTEFVKDNMLNLSLKDNSMAGVVLFYSIVNFTLKEVEIVLKDVKRILENTGILLIAFHTGDEVLHVEDWFDEEVNIDFTFFNTDEVIEIIERLSFRLSETIIRYPYKGHEYPSKRAYIICEKVAD